MIRFTALFPLLPSINNKLHLSISTNQPQHTTILIIHTTCNSTSPTMQKHAKGNRLMLSTSDDNLMLDRIQTTHVPDGRDLDVKPLLHLVEDIFKKASHKFDAVGASADVTQAHREFLEDTDFISTLESLAIVIDQVANEIMFKRSSGGDAHSTTMAMLNMLTSYSWEVKLVISIAAFAMSYGEFWLLVQNYTSNQLAKSLAMLKHLPETLDLQDVLKPRFEATQDLIKVVLDISKCVIEFKNLPSQYIAEDFAALSTATGHIPIAVYWTIRSLVACSTHVHGLVGTGQEHAIVTTEAWELSSFAHKLSDILNHLLVQLEKCNKHIDENKFAESYQNLLHMFEVDHEDNMKVLQALISANNDPQPLIDGETKKRVDIDVLKQNYVLLLISEFDIPQEDCLILEQIYIEARENNHFDVVWLPILDTNVLWTNNTKKQFEELRATMPWYTVDSPLLIDHAVNKFVKEVWHFVKKPIVVVLDRQGRVVSQDAIHMMWIWGSIRTFPFTTKNEEDLWNEERWGLELLIDGIDIWLLDRIAEGRYICLYGGEDIDWIRNFTRMAKAIAKNEYIPLEMMYVGRSNPKEKVVNNIATIRNENLSHCWDEPMAIWFFWVRIESMWRSKNKLGRTVENDPVMHDLMTILSYDGSGDGWAILSRESGGMVTMVLAHGNVFLRCLLDYSAWKFDVDHKGFINAVKDHIEKVRVRIPHHCNRFVIPGSGGKIPEKIVCMECGRQMEKLVMYQCCE